MGNGDDDNLITKNLVHNAIRKMAHLTASDIATQQHPRRREFFNPRYSFKCFITKIVSEALALGVVGTHGVFKFVFCCQ